MKTCSGGIIGMGESDEDVIDLALSLRELDVRSVPVNFLIPIPGTPFEARGALDPRRCLRVLCSLPIHPAVAGNSHRRRSRGASAVDAAARPLRRELDLHRRLSDDAGPGRSRGLRDDSRRGLRARRRPTERRSTRRASTSWPRSELAAACLSAKRASPRTAWRSFAPPIRSSTAHRRSSTIT